MVPNSVVSVASAVNRAPLGYASLLRCPSGAVTNFAVPRSHVHHVGREAYSPRPLRRSGRLFARMKRGTTPLRKGWRADAGAMRHWRFHMLNPWFAITFQAARLGLEAQNAVALRLMRLASKTEARGMLADKSTAPPNVQAAATKVAPDSA
jgi:hypothetical protein